MRPPRILVVYKKSQLEMLRRGGVLPRGADGARLRRSDRENRGTIESVCRVLDRAGFACQAVWRADLDKARRADLIVTVGGDGTFLEASHVAGTRPILGVNSDPSHSLGLFCAADRESFPALFQRWREGKLREIRLQRLAVRINGRLIREPVLNDVLFAHPNPAVTAHYVLSAMSYKRKDRRGGSRAAPTTPGHMHSAMTLRRIWTEAQKSSGVWIATAAGSTGAIHSCDGAVLPQTSGRFQFALREPVRRGRVLARHVRGILGEGARLRLVSRMRRAALYVDGGHLNYPLRWGDEVEITGGAEPLRALGLDGERRRKIFGE